ncbi:MAG: hypothetical protein HWN65_19010 [Candidatus Helarchaeota archaeon]|nr:hypothetical protein [Candidatus Helarchaeota archaeon]
MDTHGKYLIAGLVVCAEGGGFLGVGLELAWAQRILGMYFFPEYAIWIMIIIGAVSLIIGGTLLLIGLVKYRNRDNIIWQKA